MEITKLLQHYCLLSLTGRSRSGFGPWSSLSWRFRFGLGLQIRFRRGTGLARWRAGPGLLRWCRPIPRLVLWMGTGLGLWSGLVPAMWTSSAAGVAIPGTWSGAGSGSGTFPAGWSRPWTLPFPRSVRYQILRKIASNCVSFCVEDC